MSVYFITCRELGVVKIGYAYDPVDRLKTLQTAFPMKLKVEGAMPGSYERERELHRLLAKHRMKGEWFKLCPEIEAIIAEVKAPSRVKSLAYKRFMHGLREAPPSPPRCIPQGIGFPDSLPPPRVTAAFDERALSKAQRRRIAEGDIIFPFRAAAAQRGELERA